MLDHMATFDSTTWMPPAMDQQAKDYWAAEHPDDPHAAAAAAWESWAAQQADPDPATNPTVRSVTTGAQSVTYDGPTTPAGQAMARARWHRARARAYSAEVGPTYDVDLRREVDEVTYDSPPLGPTQPYQINLPGGVVP